MICILLTFDCKLGFLRIKKNQVQYFERKIKFLAKNDKIISHLEFLSCLSMKFNLLFMILGRLRECQRQINFVAWSRMFGKKAFP